MRQIITGLRKKHKNKQQLIYLNKFQQIKRQNKCQLYNFSFYLNLNNDSLLKASAHQSLTQI